MSELNTDRERLEGFKRAFPEKLMEYLQDGVSVGNLSNQVVSKLEEYELYRDREGMDLHFDDKRAEAGFEEFNKAFLRFNELLGRMISNVFDKKGEIAYYAILPKESRGKLTKPFSNLQKKYKKFILSARRSLLVVVKSGKQKYPLLELPSGTKWQNFYIKFLDEENVSVEILGREAKFGFKEMGFEDKRNGKPNRQWELLLLLAKSGGELNWKNPKADKKSKKIKELLTNVLQECFGMSEDPFFPYRELKPRSYKIRATLIPPENPDEDDSVVGGVSKEVREDFESRQGYQSNYPYSENNLSD